MPWYFALKYANMKVECSWLYDYSLEFLFSLERKEMITQSSVHELLKSLEDKDTYGPIVINQDGVVVEGIGILAAALLFDKQVEVQEVEQEAKPATFDLAQKNGLNVEILNWFVLEYMRLNPKCFNAVIWPKGRRHAPYIKKRYNTIGNVIFETPFELRNHGHYIFLQQIHGKDLRLNWFLNIYFRTRFKPAKLTLFVLETEHPSPYVRRFKQRIRREIRYDHAIHGDDSNIQAVQTCQMILHKATNDFINTITSLPEKMQHSLTTSYFKGLPNTQGEDYCITNFHQIPKDKKINYITTRDLSKLGDCKNDLYSKSEIDAFIYNPALYHYFRHAKFKKAAEHKVNRKRNFMNLDFPEQTLCRLLDKLDEA